MHRTTLYLDAELELRLKEASQSRGVPRSEIVRQALRSFLSTEVRPRVRAVGRSEDGGVAHRVDEMLDELGFGTS